MDLFARTLDALDWGAVLAALAGHARTERGRRACAATALAETGEEARRLLAEVAEVWRLEDEEGATIPVGGVGDVAALVERAGRGVPLDGGELRDVGAALAALDRLQRWLAGRAEEAPHLWARAERIAVDAGLLDTLRRAFDETGALSGEAWPELADLRERLAGLRASIRRTLDELVRGDALAHALRDRYVTERNGRFVLPIKAGARRGIGIVHGASQTGETVFVEPAAVVEPTNEAREVEAAIEREERRILAELSAEVGAFADEILTSLAAAERIDHAVARAGLGAAWKGVLPAVGDGGVLRLRAARHPVLVLRGVAVVPNDLAVDARRPGLVLTGPNTGGKTVALKTMGLAALLARAGVPVPAAEGSRVDAFAPVLADVGDLQAVAEDRSTFSGRVLVLREMLDRAAPGALVLLDEVGSGTDPAQGAALARAALEALVDAGARVVATSHFAELRGLAAADSRFEVAAVQVADGRPTYRVAPGIAGQSHAFAVARRVGLPAAVVARARTLLDAGARQLADLMERLDEDRARVAAREAALAAREAELAEREAALAAREAELARRRARLREEVIAGLQERLRERERRVKELVAALQADPNLRRAGRALEAIRSVRAELREAEREDRPAPAPPPKAVAVGDAVLVPSLGRKGTVTALLGRDRVEVAVGAMRLKLRRAELSAASSSGGRAAARRPPPRPAKPRPAPSRLDPAELRGVRTPANTCDLRGRRVDEALAEAERFVDAAALRGEPVVFLLHGHGTGALKAALRAWLPAAPHVRAWRPARADEGGDAYTLVGL